jgi:hypothetical protein
MIMPRTLAIAGVAAAVVLAAVLSVIVTDWLIMAGLWPSW